MGARGRIPERSENRIRRNKDYPEVTTLAAGERTVGPWDPDPSWHPLAVELWEATQESGQSALYEVTDWWQVYLICEVVSRELKPQFIGFQQTVEKDADGEIIFDGDGQAIPTQVPMQAAMPIKGASLTAIRAMMATVLMTEGDRRRLSVELQRAGAGAGDGVEKDQAQIRSMMEALRKKTGTPPPPQVGSA